MKCSVATHINNSFIGINKKYVYKIVRNMRGNYEGNKFKFG